MLRSILAVLAGIAALSVTSFGIEAAVNAVFPNAPKALMFAYGFACVAFGGYVTARIAQRRPLPHTAVMALLQAGLTILAMFSPAGNHAPQAQWIATAMLTIPAALLGGALRQRSMRISNR